MRADEAGVATGALNSFVATAVGMATGVVLSVLVARALGPAELGLYTLSLTVVTALEAVAGLGLARAALKFSAELGLGARSAPVLRLLLSRRLLSAGVAAMLLALLAQPVAGLLGQPALGPLLLLAAPLLAINLLGSVFESALEGASRFGFLARLGVGLAPLQVAATLGALQLGLGAAGVLGAHLVVGCAGLAAMAAGTRRLAGGGPPAGLVQGPLDPELRRRVLRFARHGYLLSLLGFVIRDRVEVLVLGALSTPEQVGFYGLAFGAAEAAMRLGPWVVATVFFPLLAAAWQDNAPEQAGERYRLAVRYLWLAAAPLALGGIVLAEHGVAVVFGPPYAAMVPVLQVCLLATGAAALAQGPSALLTAAERQSWLLRARCWLAAGNVALDLLLVPTLGALGAALANLATQAAEVAWLSLLAGRRLGAGWPFGACVRALACGILAALVAKVVAGPTWWALGLSVLLAGLVYFAALKASGAIRPEDAEIVRPLVSRLPASLRAPCGRFFGPTA